MKALVIKHKNLWNNRTFVVSVSVSLLLLIISFCVNYVAVKVATEDIGNSTTDILLDNLPVVNTDFIVSEGAAIFTAFIVFLCIFDPKIIPFLIKSIALFIFIRALFVVMTHLAPFPNHINADYSNLKYISSGSDLFFSGHTGMPFLLSLIFWDHKLLRYVFLAISIIAAVGVILGHLHYTIDVFSAFFITFGIYHMVLKFFTKDYRLFLHGPETN